MVNGGGVGSTLTLRDPSNSWSQDWQKTLPGDGYPGYNVQVDIDHDKILSGDTPKPGSYRGRMSNEPENNRKTLMDLKNA